MHIQRIRIRIALIGAFLLAAALLELPVVAQPKTITFLHTNDVHASFLPHEAVWVRTTPKPYIGGYNELKYRVDSIRAANPLTVLVDAGDIMTGNPICDIEYKGASGGALFEMMNRIGYDVWCPGNHDFDLGQDNLRGLTRVAAFPTLSANIVTVDGAFPVNNRPYAIIERGGVKIGFIGIMSQELYGLVNQNNLVGIKVLSPVETARQYIKELRPRVDLLVALTHQGVAEDSLLAEEAPGLDIVIGGHSHTRLREPRVVDDVLIVQAGTRCENLGVLDVTLEDGEIDKAEGRLIPLWPEKRRPVTPVSSLVDSMESVIDRDFSAVIGTLTADWVRRPGGSAIGAFITEAQRAAARADVAFMNDGGIRKDLSAGPITKRDLFEVLPFRNVLMTFQLSGTQLASVVRHYLQKETDIQIAGLEACTKENDNGASEVVSISVQGKPLEGERMYICAASDYFVGEAKRYIGIEVSQAISLQQTVFSAVEEAIRQKKEITPKRAFFLQQVR